MFILFVWVMWIFVVIRMFIDNLERRDHGGWAKAMWTVVIVFLPVIGVCANLIARPTEVVVA
jgi:hypothetical protein